MPVVMKVNKIKGLVDVSKDPFELLSKEQKLLLEHKGEASRGHI